MTNIYNGITYEKAKQLLTELVKIPSISKNEWELANRVNKFCNSIGMDSQIDRHGNVIAHISTGIDGPKLAFNSHLDTVDVGDGWQVDPFGAEIHDRNLYGLGASDCKGSLAGILLALEAILKKKHELCGELLLTAVVQEEVQSENAKGTVKLIQDGFTADMVIVGEPTMLDICIGCEGMIEIEVSTKGIGVHASQAENGVNAIEKMMDIMAEIKKIKPGWHPVLGHGAINPGVIQGGSRSSVVPDFCTLKCGRFIVPGESAQQFLAEINSVLAELKSCDESFEASARITYDSNAAVLEKDHPLVLFMQEATQSLGLNANIVGMRAHLDADFLMNMVAIPCVTFGPGDMNRGHKANEFIEIEDVVTAATVYTRAVEIILGKKSTGE